MSAKLLTPVSFPPGAAGTGDLDSSNFSFVSAKSFVFGDTGLTSSAALGDASGTLTTPPNRPTTKSFIPPKKLEIVSVIGLKKSPIDANKVFKVSSYAICIVKK